MVAIAAIITACALLVVRRLHLGVPGVSWWAVANVCAAVGFILGVGRGVLPDVLTIVVFNVLLVAATTLALTGCRLFVGRSGLWWLTPAAAACTLALVVWFTYVQPSPMTRMVSIPLAVSVPIGLSGWTLLSGSSSLARRVTGILYLVHGSFYLVRGLLSIGADIPDVMAPNLMMQVALICTFVFMLSAILGQIVMTTERLQEELRRQADRDSLTDVFNRRSFRLMAEKELARVVRADGVVSVLCMDIDRFKQLNDRHGHAAGDAMLCAFVAATADCLRAQDILCRHGGEEFVALLPDTDAAGAEIVAERVRCAVSGISLRQDGGAVATTVSIGIAASRGADARLDDLLRRADEALYRAKAEGRDRVVAA
jgi:diguanylate cyclase (GGDEF)-like protein